MPNLSKQNNAVYLHYLGLGSHPAPYQLTTLSTFSIITLNPKERLPEIRNNK
jgi:hypothetical protein